MSWGVNTDRPPIVNVFPLDDEQEHNLDDPFLCWCEPKQEGNLYIHHSADQREAVEQAEEFLKRIDITDSWVIVMSYEDSNYIAQGI